MSALPSPATLQYFDNSNSTPAPYGVQVPFNNEQQDVWVGYDSATGKLCITNFNRTAILACYSSGEAAGYIFAGTFTIANFKAGTINGPGFPTNPKSQIPYASLSANEVITSYFVRINEYFSAPSGEYVQLVSRNGGQTSNVVVSSGSQVPLGGTFNQPVIDVVSNMAAPYNAVLNLQPDGGDSIASLNNVGSVSVWYKKETLPTT
jgi:hypothetical protein